MKFDLAAVGDNLRNDTAEEMAVPFICSYSNLNITGQRPSQVLDPVCHSSRIPACQAT